MKKSANWFSNATVVYYEALKCTKNGNPRYEVIFDIENLGTRKLVTDSDAMWVYGIGFNNGKKYAIEWRRKGKSWNKFVLVYAKEI